MLRKSIRQPDQDQTARAPLYLSGSDPRQPGRFRVLLSRGAPASEAIADPESMEEQIETRIRDDFQRARAGWAPACLRVVHFPRGSLDVPAPSQQSNATFPSGPLRSPLGVDIDSWSNAMINGGQDGLFAALANSRERPQSDVATGDIVMAYVSEMNGEGNLYGLSSVPNIGVFLVHGRTLVSGRTFAHELGHTVTGTFDRPMEIQHFYPPKAPDTTWLDNDAYVVSSRRVALTDARIILDGNGRFVYSVTTTTSPGAQQ